MRPLSELLPPPRRPGVSDARAQHENRVRRETLLLTLMQADLVLSPFDGRSPYSGLGKHYDERVRN